MLAAARVLDLHRPLTHPHRLGLRGGREFGAARLEHLQLGLEAADLTGARDRSERRARPTGQCPAAIQDFPRGGHEHAGQLAGAEAAHGLTEVVDEVDVLEQPLDDRAVLRGRPDDLEERTPQRYETERRGLGPAQRQQRRPAPGVLRQPVEQLQRGVGSLHQQRIRAAGQHGLYGQLEALLDAQHVREDPAHAAPPFGGHALQGRVKSCRSFTLGLAQAFEPGRAVLHALAKQRQLVAQLLQLGGAALVRTQRLGQPPTQLVFLGEGLPQAGLDRDLVLALGLRFRNPGLADLIVLPQAPLELAAAILERLGAALECGELR